MSGISESLLEHARQEGVDSALRIAQDWQQSLESMCEVCSFWEGTLLRPCLGVVNGAIKDLLTMKTASKAAGETEFVEITLPEPVSVGQAEDWLKDHKENQ